MKKQAPWFQEWCIPHGWRWGPPHSPASWGQGPWTWRTAPKPTVPQQRGCRHTPPSPWTLLRFLGSGVPWLSEALVCSNSPFSDSPPPPAVAENHSQRLLALGGQVFSKSTRNVADQLHSISSPEGWVKAGLVPTSRSQARVGSEVITGSRLAKPYSVLNTLCT